MKRSVIDKAEPSNPPVHDGEGRRQHLGPGGGTGGGPGGGTGGPAGKARFAAAAAAAAVLAAAIFASDLSLPLGVAGGVPYVGVVLLGWWFGSPRAVFALAAICTILTAFGYLFSPAGGIAWMVLVNRTLALAAIWVTAILVNHAKTSETRVRTARDEEALHRGKEEFDLVANNIPVLISFIGNDRRFRFVNKGYEDWYGIPQDRIIGRHMRELYGEARYRELEALATKALNGERVQYEARVTYAKNTERYISAEWIPHVDETGVISGIVTLTRDITEHKRLEGEVLRQERLATLGQLTATVSHELRNPLGVIRTSAYIINSGLDAPDPRTLSAIARIERSVVRCDRIIDELLDFTRISELDPEPTPLNSWLGRTLAEQNLPSGVELRLNFGNDATTAALDHDRFRRAVINVFDNACQAMTDPDSQNRDTKDSVLSVTTQVSGDRIEIVFEDNGAGIAADVRPMIFEPLFSTKGFGVGLGLSVVRQIMDQHGGGIEIDSQPGRGTRVCLWLPNTDDP